MNTPSAPGVFSAFLPLCLVSLSVAIFMGWQVSLGIEQRQELIRMGERQKSLASQAAQTESQLQALMMDLLRLAETDKDARAIISKYNIRFNPPADAAAPAATAGTAQPIQPAQPATAPAAMPAVETAN